MKSCPTCNRTYHDEFSFCLMDGSILSAPYRSDETQIMPTAQSGNLLPTEVIDPKAFIEGEVLEFTEDEEGYRHWLEENPSGFVIHTTQTMNPNRMFIHRATCPHISSLDMQYRFVGNGNAKVCASDIERLKEWIQRHGRLDGSFSRICKTCKPLDESSDAQLVDDNWHGYVAGQQATASEVVAKCLQYLSSGKVKNPQQKLKGIEAINRYGQAPIVYSPQGKGWGNSPMNPNCWRTSDGKPI